MEDIDGETEAFTKDLTKMDIRMDLVFLQAGQDIVMKESGS